MKRILIVFYRSPERCLAAFHGCSVAAVPRLKGRWYFRDRSGRRRWTTARRSLKDVKAKGSWGWVESKRRMHLWISSRCSLEDAVALVAHELGHAERPWLAPDREEVKAGKYERVAAEAVRVVMRMRKERDKRKGTR